MLKTEILNYIGLFIISYQTFEYIIDDVMFILKTTTKYFMRVWDMKVLWYKHQRWSALHRKIRFKEFQVTLSHGCFSFFFLKCVGLENSMIYIDIINQRICKLKPQTRECFDKLNKANIIFFEIFVFSPPQIFFSTNKIFEIFFFTFAINIKFFLLIM